MLNVTFNKPQRYGAYALVEFLVAAVLAVFRKPLVHHFAPGQVSLSALIVVVAIALLLVSLVHMVLVMMARKWDAWFSLLFAILTFFISQIIAVLLLQLAAVFIHQSPNQVENGIVGQFVYTLIAEGLVIAAVIGYARHFKISLSSLAIKKPRFVDFLYGVAGFLPYFIIFAVAESLIAHYVHGFNASQHQEIGFDDVHGGVELVLTFISVVVLAPLAEETIFRGLIYSSLKKVMPILSATLVTSLIFASAHLPEGGSSGPLYIGALDTFILSLVLVYLRQKTDSLWPGITLHATKNFVAFVALYILHAH